jgi:hypothetical protein
MSQLPASSVFERHAQTALTVAIISIMAWVGMSVSGSREAIARLEVTVKFLQMDVVDLRKSTEKWISGRYTQSMSNRDLRVIHKRLDILEDNAMKVNK